MRIITLMLMIGAIGCGGSSSIFAGAWTSAVSEQEDCPSGSHVTPLDGPFTIGGSSTVATTESANGCDLNWNVNGDSATLQPNQTCSVPGSVGGTWKPTFTSGTLVLNGDVITVNDAGNATLVLNGNTACTFTQSGTFTRP